MKALALVALAVLAAAALARGACRYVVRACIAAPRACRRAVVRVGAAVEAFAYAHVTSPVVWEVEPEPTVCERLQLLLAAGDARVESRRLLGRIVDMQQDQLATMRATDAMRAEMAAVDELARAEAELAHWRNVWDRRRAVGIPVH